MADQLPNGTSHPDADVEMKEDGVASEQAVDNIQQQQQFDPTDPNPPPQQQSAIIDPAVLSQQTEHMSTILPNVPSVAVATPPSITTAAQARPTSMPPQPAARPDKPVTHGGPTRQFLNSHITPHLLEGMKHLAVAEPEKPLLWLSEFLKDRSKEVEGA